MVAWIEEQTTSGYVSVMFPAMTIYLQGWPGYAGDWIQDPLPHITLGTA